MLAQGIDVTWVLLTKWKEHLDPRVQIRAVFVDAASVFEALQSLEVDCVLVEQWQPLTFFPEKLNKPVIVDLPGPLMLEYFWRDPEAYLQHMTDKVLSLGKADYFTCALERQVGYYTAWLTWAGFSPESNRICVTPFLMHEMPLANQRHTVEEPALFWGGMFWPWHDRFDVFQTIVRALEQCQRGQLVVSGWDGQGSCPDPRYNEFIENAHITWLGNNSFTDYINELKQSHVAIDLSKPTLERGLSSDLRTGTALWAGTPCIVTPQSPWASFIRDHNAGWVIEYSDRKTLTAVVQEIALESGDRAKSWRGAKSVSGEISQHQKIQPLLDMTSSLSPIQPPTPFWSQRDIEREEKLRELQNHIDRLQHENETLTHELSSIRNNPLFKIYKKISGLLKQQH